MSTQILVEVRSGISDDAGHDPAMCDEGTEPSQRIRHNRVSKNPLANEPLLLPSVAMRSLNDALSKLQRKLFVISESAELSLIYREMAFHVQDIGILLALSHRHNSSASLVYVSRILRLLAHMLSNAGVDQSCGLSDAVHESAVYFFGGLFSSHFGIVEAVNAMEDAEFERIWLKCWFRESLNNQELLSSEIRNAPGVLSIAEEVQKCSRNFNISSTVEIPIASIGAATTSLIDCWRTAQEILHLQLGDMEQVRRHSDVISRACLELAKLCTYECGREVYPFFITCLLIGPMRCFD